MTDLSLAVTNLTKRYGSVWAAREMTFSTPSDWRCLGILGRNGAGKTTLLKMLAGLLKPTAGEISVRYGNAVFPSADASLAVYIDEKPTLVDSMTGTAHLDFYEALNDLAGVSTNREARARLIAEFQVASEIAKPMGHMSKGTKRKVEMIAALSTETPVIIADELPEGVDVPSMYAFECQIRRMTELGRRFVISSHDISFIADTCDFLAIIDRGCCVDSFAVSSLKEPLKERVLKAFGSLPPDDPPASGPSP